MSKELDNPQMDVYGGVRWSAIGAWGQQLVQFGIGIVLARLLMPRDFGLLAMATVFIGFLGIFKYMGFHTAVVQRRQVDEALLSSLYYFVLAVSGLLFVATVAAAPVVAWVYGEPRVMGVTAVLGIGFLLSAPCLIPFSVLSRQMKFGRLAVADLVSGVIGGGVSIALAVAGLGVWALAIGSLVGTAVCTLLYQALSQWRPRLIFRWSEVRSVFSFGANITGFSLFNYFARNADNFIIGAFLGAGPLGFYSLAYGILLKPRDAVTNVLMRVLFPAFSRMQDDDARLKAVYLRACGAIAFVTFPMMLGLMVVAHPFVQVVLGEKWLPAVPLIYVLAPLGMIQSIWSTVGQLYLAKGRADWQLRWGLFSGIIIMVSFLIGVPWGVFGVAVSYTAACVILLPVGFYVPFLLVQGLRLRDLAGALFPHVLSAGLMAIAVACFRAGLSFLGVRSDMPTHLFFSVGIGIVVYCVLVFYVRPQALTDLRRLLPTPSFLFVHESVSEGVSAQLVDHSRKPAILSD
ncbi:MAG: MOP flippase family protein [Planctomycetes bacterium]|nr:MOP flippase family protein [Planctomycetota bacterium]